MKTIEYAVSCLAPHTHHIDVEVRVPVHGPAAVDLALAVWTPGAYAVVDFAGSIHGVSFVDETGKTLEWSKTDKTTWRVRPGRASTVIGRYKVHAFDIGVHRSYLDDRGCMLNGASVFMYVPDRKSEPVHVTFEIPPSWKRVDTGLARVKGKHKWSYAAPGFDELIDSPVVMGNQTVEKFQVNSIDHEMVFVGDGNWNPESFKADTQRIVEQAIAVFGHIPYERYTFIFQMAEEKYGGLEHRNSTHIIVPRWGFKPRKEYIRAIGLTAHEFFHTWNVKRLRPYLLGPFDYTKEVRTPLLWFAEGVTSYYDQLLLRRSDCISPRELLDEYGREIRRLQQVPGRFELTLEDSSLDAWTKLYKATPDSPNTTISYYNKGSLVAWLLDLEIRHRTRGKKNLDHVMRALYEEYFVQKDRGVTSDEIEAACSKVAGGSLTPFFDHLVRSTKEVDFNRHLRQAGLEIAEKSKAGRPLKPGDEGERAYLGIRLTKEGSNTVVSQVIGNGPASQTGLSPRDELIAFDGHRADPERLDRWLAHQGPGHKGRLLVSRMGQILEYPITLGTRPLEDFSIQPLAKADALQKAIYKNWTKARWEDLDRPENGFDMQPRERIY